MARNNDRNYVEISLQILMCSNNLSFFIVMSTGGNENLFSGSQLLKFFRQLLVLWKKGIHQLQIRDKFYVIFREIFETFFINFRLCHYALEFFQNLREKSFEKLPTTECFRRKSRIQQKNRNFSGFKFVNQIRPNLRFHKNCNFRIPIFEKTRDPKRIIGDNVLMNTIFYLFHTLRNVIGCSNCRCGD